MKSASGTLAWNQAAVEGSVTNISPARKPSKAAPRVMITGKRSMIFISSVLPAMMSGIDSPNPTMSSGKRAFSGRLP